MGERSAGMGRAIGRATSPLRAARSHPRASAGVAVLLVAAGLWAWWATQLWGLPDVGDPFDVEAFEAVRIPDDRNAFVVYRDAASMLEGVVSASRRQKRGLVWIHFPGEWSEADQAWRDFLADGRAALDLWRSGSDRPDARYDHPEGLSLHTLLPVTQKFFLFVRMGALEGSRLQAEGDMAGAWGWYRAVLRSSRHSGRHGLLYERLVGAAMHKVGAGALTRWADDPRVDAPLLRQALAEVIAIDALTAPRSDAIKWEYLVFIHTMDDPDLVEDLLTSRQPGDPGDWCQDLPVADAAKRPIQAARLLAANDRERSLRVARLMTANWLAQVDRPPSRRARLAQVDPPIYEADPTAPPASRALPPGELAKWLDSSLLARWDLRHQVRYAPLIDRERIRQARLVVHLADRLYRRERGGPPPTPQALVGTYLEALPEGYDAPDEGPDDAP